MDPPRERPEGKQASAVAPHLDSGLGQLPRPDRVTEVVGVIAVQGEDPDCVPLVQRHERQLQRPLGRSQPIRRPDDLPVSVGVRRPNPGREVRDSVLGQDRRREAPAATKAAPNRAVSASPAGTDCRGVVT